MSVAAVTKAAALCRHVLLAALRIKGIYASSFNTNSE